MGDEAPRICECCSWQQDPTLRRRQQHYTQLKPQYKRLRWRYCTVGTITTQLGSIGRPLHATAELLATHDISKFHENFDISLRLPIPWISERKLYNNILVWVVSWTWQQAAKFHERLSQHSLANRHSCSTWAETRDRKCFSMQLILVVGKMDNDQSNLPDVIILLNLFKVIVSLFCIKNYY